MTSANDIVKIYLDVICIGYLGITFHWVSEMTYLLNRVNSPSELKTLDERELPKLAAEIRELLIDTVSENGGHLVSSLGVVELTIALHRVFKSPEDKLVWDVGQQSYPHKLLTGRKERFDTLRQYRGISGFPEPEESPHDAFGAVHAGNSVSAAVGMALARDLEKSTHHVIAVIGDGSLGAGTALEAINHAGQLGTKLIVVLNDNAMSISPSVGALSRILNQVRFDRRYEFAKSDAKNIVTRLPLGHFAWRTSKKVKDWFQSVLLPSAFWEQFGFTYLGPVDGHNIRALEAALSRARDFESKPAVIHVLTTKGKGHAPAEANSTKFHGIHPNGNKPKTVPSYSHFFGNSVSRLMKENEKAVAISAAMLDGTGLAQVATKLSDIGVDGFMISPVFDFKAVGSNVFLTREGISRVFQPLASMRQQFHFYNTSAYLDFLLGKKEVECMPWSTPTLTPKGWRRPCYLIADKHCRTYRELMEETEWDKFGVGKDPRCANCMVHCGFEASLIDHARRSLPELFHLARR